MESEFQIEVVDFAAHSEELRSIRFAVFVQEQGVPAELEMDEADAAATHVLARDAEGRAVGTGRILPDGHIGRVAVLSEYRGQRCGLAIMEALMQVARDREQSRVWLASQTRAAGFYEAVGFIAISAIYLEAGIEHMDMELRI